MQLREKIPTRTETKKLFIKIENKMFLLKHIGLAKTTRKVRQKNSAKITLSQNPRTSQLKPKEQKINNISGNCQEKLKFFNHKETSSLVQLNLSAPIRRGLGRHPGSQNTIQLTILLILQ